MYSPINSKDYSLSSLQARPWSLQYPSQAVSRAAMSRGALRASRDLKDKFGIDTTILQKPAKTVIVVSEEIIDLGVSNSRTLEVGCYDGNIFEYCDCKQL